MAVFDEPIGAQHNRCGDTYTDDSGRRHPCGCNGYKGDGGPCINRFRDPFGPGFGEDPLRNCGHSRAAHDIEP